jgi:disulfide bond formation protein DsbB
MINLIAMMVMPKYLIRLLAAGSGFMIVMAAVFEYGLGLHPCTMCYWQRVPHWLVMALGLFSIWGGLPRITSRHLLAAAAVSLLVGAGIAGWHSGVELKLLPGPTACSGGIRLDGNPADLLQELLAAPQVRCDQVSWSLLGLSMAGWNGIISIFMAGVAVLRFRATRQLI